MKISLPASKFFIVTASIAGFSFVAAGQNSAPVAPTSQPLTAQFSAPDKGASWSQIFDANWSKPAFSAKSAYSIEFDTALKHAALSSGKAPLVIKSQKPFSSGIEMRARFQLAAPAGQNATFTLRMGADGAAGSGVGATIGALNHETQTAGVTLFRAGQAPIQTSYKVKAYTVISPTWEAETRSAIEHSMAALPKVNERWYDLRIQIADERVRYYLDDNMLAEEAIPNASGFVQAELSPFVRLASLQISSLPNLSSSFEVLPMDNHLNASVLANGKTVDFKSLPTPGKPAQLSGVPFVFAPRDARGNDHIDVGESQMRQANARGYLPTNAHRFKGASEIDPARIQFKIPNGRYDALYLVAASDGDENNIPLISASFYKPDAGFAKYFEANVPAARARSTEVTPLPVRMSDGKKSNLWLVKIPLAPGELSSFSYLPYLELELSKKMQLYRSYPDPISYGWHPGGLPSGVHVYAMTLHRPDVDFEITPKKYGHVWAANETPEYSAKLVNRSANMREVNLQVNTRSYDGLETESWNQKIVVPANASRDVESIVLATRKYGYHDVVARIDSKRESWTEKRSLVKLAPDTRAAKWREGHGPLIGNWAYFGAHDTPGWEEHLRLMQAAGARTAKFLPRTPEQYKVFADLGMVQHEAFYRAHWITGYDWLNKGGFKADDPQASIPWLVDALKKHAVAPGAGVEPDFVPILVEPAISRDLTAGNLPEYWGDPAYQMNADEKKTFDLHWALITNSARAIKKEWPNMKVLVPWGDPLYVVPFLRAGLPKELFDGTALDTPNFERLPEQQLHQISLHRLYELRQEFAKAGIADPQLYFVEGFFVPTEPGAVGLKEQMDIYTRGLLISLGYGVQRFYSWGGVFFDAADYYGAEHYGGNGLFNRIPYVNPKPSYAGYATTTQMMDGAHFEKWIPTGSHSTYCMKFKKENGGLVYALWTLRGKRQVTLNGVSEAKVTDMMGNDAPTQKDFRGISFSTDGSPVWVTNVDEDNLSQVDGIRMTTPGDNLHILLGAPDHSDSKPGARSGVLGNLGDGTWRVSSERDMIYENNNYDTKRFFGPISARQATENGKGKVLAIHLGTPEKERLLMPFYRILQPAKPIAIQGKASHIGLWVKGNSDWGRVVYNLRDAKGERWSSVGTKDEYNADDLHSWSKFNFDGWRYLKFEIPSHLPYDNFREAGTTWWGSYGGDGVVDLPLRLENIIVERRTHILYVNDVQPADKSDVLLGELVAEYSRPEDASVQTEKLSHVRMRVPRAEAQLPNPIAEMMKTGVGAPTEIREVTAPQWGYDGTRGHVHFREVAGAQSYDIWLSAHPDGRGAVRQAANWKKSGELLQGLRPAMDLYLFVTYKDADGKISRPSAAFKINLVDAFGMK